MNDIDLDKPAPEHAIEVVTQSYAPERVETHLSPLDVAPEVFKAGLDRRRQNHKALVEWVRKALVQDVDFGKIHTVGKNRCDKGKLCKDESHFSKPSLFKPGAEKINAMLGVTPHFPTIKDYEQAAVSGVAVETIILRCELKDSYGNVVAEGVGARLVSKDYGDINKALKMAEKSGQIDATLRLAGLSEVFTQDIEQMVEDGVFDKGEWQRQDRAKFKEEKGYSQTANYATGGNRDAVLKRDGFACVEAEIIAPGPPQAHPGASSRDVGSVAGPSSREAAPARAPVSPETQRVLDESRARREAAAAGITSTPEGRQRVRDAGFTVSEPEERSAKCRKCAAEVKTYTAKAGHRFDQCSAARGNPAVYDEGGHTYKRLKD